MYLRAETGELWVTEAATVPQPNEQSTYPTTLPTSTSTHTKTAAPSPPILPMTGEGCDFVCVRVVQVGSCLPMNETHQL